MSDTIVVQSPAAATHLFLLFHGVGATASGLLPLAQRLAAEFPQAAVVSVASPFDSDLGAGRQWFSVRGVTEENRGARIDAAMPLFERTVRQWQQQYGLDAAATTLAGFSQGAIMALESARAGKALAGRFVAIAGRFAQLPDTAPQGRIHFIHGQDDAVIPCRYAVDGQERVVRAGGDATADVVPYAGHQITPAMANAMIGRLRGDDSATAAP